MLAHNPPKVAGCPLIDSECFACQVTKKPSPSYELVRMCEMNLSQSCNYSVAQVQYVLEMCEDLFLVKCGACRTAVTRATFKQHQADCQ